jgi:S1-C subfamily serine protease
VPVGWQSLIIGTLAFTGALSGAGAARGDAAGLFSSYKDRLLQVRVIDLEAGDKSAVGTAFLVDRDGLIATNFHVISEWVHRPDRYRLESVDREGGKGDLEVLDVDVVNDLALLRGSGTRRRPLVLARAAPEQGETIYSLGNPFDLGFTVVPGTYNGVSEASCCQHILFSGSLNAGMSGGPVLNARGQVVGVNVASAGNQVSFLVPAGALARMIAARASTSPPVTDFHGRVREQLTANQAKMFGDLFAQEWRTKSLGEATVLDEMQPYTKCWGQSSDSDTLFKSVASSCRGEHRLYLGSGLTTGVIGYQFYWMEADRLSAGRFRSYYQSMFSSFVPDNQAARESAGNFVCDELFVEDPAANIDKAVLCVRAYRQYAGLYDALYVRGSVDLGDRAFVSHFTLAGVTQDTIVTFLRRFQEVVRR